MNDANVRQASSAAASENQGYGLPVRRRHLLTACGRVPQSRGPHGQLFVRGVESRGPHGQLFVRGVESLP
jgi:hypothetical protein